MSQIESIDYHQYGKTIAAGDIDDDAKAWLKKHGAIINWELGVTVILLPKTANVHQAGGYRSSEYTIDFYHGDDEASEWIEIELDIDAGSTTAKLVIEKKEETDGKDE